MKWGNILVTVTSDEKDFEIEYQHNARLDLI